MSKNTLALILYVFLVTIINIYLWYDIVQAGPAPRAGRMFGLIIMLAGFVLFADKLSRKQFAPEFIRAGGLIGMTLLMYFLYQHSQ